MNTTLTVALRDLRERRNMLLLSVALTLVPFLAATLPAARPDRPAAIGIASLILAVGFGFGTAIALGSSVVTGDLAQRRLSFYFARPVSSAAIWFGKGLGAILASLLGFLIIVLPALILAERTWGGMGISRWGFVGTCTVGILTFFLVSHMVSTSIRSRSPLIVLDLVLALVTIFAAYHLARPLVLGGAAHVVGALAAIIGVAMLAILAAAPVWQLARGRADIRRSHAALSKAVWGSMLLLLLIAAAYVWWMISPSPYALTKTAGIFQSPSGSTAGVVGTAKGRGDYNASFLLDIETGEYHRLKSPLWWGEAWSRDGKTFAWVEALEMYPKLRLELFTRTSEQGEIVGTGIPVTAGSRFVLSDDGSRVAIAEDRKVEVHDLRQKRLLTAANMPGEGAGTVRALYFLGPDVVRVLRHTRGGSPSMQILELDVNHRAVTVLGRLAADTGYAPVTASADGSRLLLRREARVVDGKTGAELFSLPATQNLLRSTMLNDGRVVMVVPAGERTRLEVLSPEGSPSGEIPLPVAESGWVTGETEDGKLIVLLTRKVQGTEKNDRSMLIVDLQTGTVEKHLEGLRGPMPQWGADPRLARYAAGATFLAVDHEGKLVTWDSTTGQRKTFRSR